MTTSIHKIFLAIILFFAINNSFGQSYTVTKTYSGGTVNVDNEVVTLPAINFSTADFPMGCVIEDVSVVITWTKTGGGNCNSNSAQNAYHNETGFTISGPTGNVVLAPTGTWSGGANIGSVTTTFNNTGTSPSGTPITGSFGASGSLASFDGDNPIGDWNLLAEDTAFMDPLCINSYSISITVVDIEANAGPNIIVCEGDTTNLSASGNGTGLSYFWDNGLGAGQNQSFIYTMSGVLNENVDYTVTITDANGCTDTDIVRVRYRANPISTVSIVDATCGLNNGSITFTFPNHPSRTNIQFSLDGQSSYESNIADNSGSITYSSLAVGDYDLWVRWGNTQCPVDLGIFTISDEDTADLSLTKTANTSVVNVGDEVLFTLIVTNSGPCDVTGISVRDGLPTGLIYNDPNSTLPAGTTYSSGIWDLTSLILTDGDTATFVLAATVGPDCGDITNIAEIITSSKTDPDSTPNSGN